MNLSKFGLWVWIAVIAIGLALVAGSAILIRMLFTSRSQPTPRQPQAPNLQQLFLTPIITTRSAPATDLKTYTNKGLGISIIYPSNLYLHREGWENTNPPQTLWSISWANMEYDKVKDVGDPNTKGIKLRDLYALGYYSISVFIDNNPVYRAPYTTETQPITESNLELLMGGGLPKPAHTTFQGRPAVRAESTSVSGYSPIEIGGSVDYYILDQRRVIRLEGSTYNLQKVSISAIEEILSSLKFLD